jgi:hypothetical protein
VIAVDPDKAWWTAAAVNASLRSLDIIGYRPAATVTGCCADSPDAGPIPVGLLKAPPAWAPH